MNAKSRAKQQGIIFTLSIEDINIPKVCPLIGEPIVLGTAKQYANAASIDRLNPKKGYVPGNIRVISTLANRMKSNATKEQLLSFAKNIGNYMTDEIV